MRTWSCNTASWNQALTMSPKIVRMTPGMNVKGADTLEVNRDFLLLAIVADALQAIALPEPDVHYVCSMV